MTETLPFGTENATHVRVASPSRNNNGVRIASLQNLVDALRENPPEQIDMLRSTAGKQSEFFGLSCDQISIASMVEKQGEFRQFLADCKYAKNSIRSYSHYANVLIKLAKKLGWVYVEPAMPDEWSKLMPATLHSNCVAALKYFASQGRLPSAVTEEDLEAWVRTRMVEHGRSYEDSRRKANSFRRVLVSAGFTANLSTRATMPRYGTPRNLLPEALRRELDAVLKWKQATFAPSRPRKAQIRAITAKTVQRDFCELYGFATNIRKCVGISTIQNLVTEDIVTAYVVFLLDDRGVKASTVDSNLSRVCAALRYYPAYKEVDFTWIRKLLESLPASDEEAIRRRKEKKYLPHSVVSAIPKMLRADRPKAAIRGPKKLALMVRDQLLMQWLVTLPWRQRNIRECRISGPSPNLFKGQLRTNIGIDKPSWVRETLKQNPNAEFWQFCFCKEETKTGNSLHCILPLKLIVLLEEYLSDYRKVLVHDSDPGTLFVKANGKAMEDKEVKNTVSGLTLRYGGRVVTPHLFRDIFAYMWLEKFPADYVTLSKLLWHRNINTTLNVYGARYNESSALCRMEDML